MGERYRMIEKDNNTAAEFYVKACDAIEKDFDHLTLARALVPRC